MTLPIAMKNHSLLQLLKGFAAAFILAASTCAAFAAAPDIAVEDASAANIADGGSKAFGSVNVGSNTSLTFTIKNTGDADLTGLAITKSGAHQADFSVTASPTSPVTGPSGTTTFTVQFSPSASGSRNAAIQIASNDSDENPFDISLSGTGTAPEIVVEQPAATGISSGGTKSFGSVNVGANSSLVFTIKNTGSADLTGLTITKDGTNEADFSVTANPTAPVAGPSGSTTFTVRFTPSAMGNRSAAIHIANNDSNENPFDINLTGTGLAPDIAVEVPLGTPVTPTTVGGANLGSVTVNKVASITFNITNPGNSNLTLSNVSLVSGTSSAITIKSNLTSTTVTPSGTSQFTLQFIPTTTGAFTGSVSIPTNVTGKNPYVISFTGTGVASIPNTDDFGYSMDVAAPATAAAYLKSTDPDVLVPGGLLVDDAALLADIGFSFKFYDKTYTKCFISTNGLISFDEGVTAWSPTAIPSTSSPDNYIAPFWSDLKPGADGGAILYATRGTAPNRTFIVKWEEVPEYYVPTRKVTFQLTLHENSNSIEVQYKDISAGFGDTRTYAGMGIESRNYGAIQPQPASNVIGLKAAHGLVDTANKDIDGKPIKSFPYAIRYTRPVVFTVESNYQQPTALDPAVTTTVPTPLTGPTDLSILPTVKTHYKTPIGTNQRFEAPEAIYLDRNFAKLSSPGEVSGPPEKLAWYRLVNDGYAIDGQVVQGTHAFFSTTLDRDVTVVWRWRLEYAAIIESGKPNGGAVNEGGRQWFKPGDQFTAIIDSPLDGLSDAAGMRLIVQGYSMFDRSGGQIGTEVPVTAGAYVSSNPFSMTQPIRLRWRWAGQVRYRFDAKNTGLSPNLLNNQSFIRIYNSDNTTIAQTIYGVGADMPVWINVGAKVDVGAFYRSSDRRLTLADFQAPPGGNLSPIGSSVSSLADNTTVDTARLARLYTINVVTVPTDIHWLYGPTVFRAEVPLGQSFDPKDPDAQLVPDLATGGNLRAFGAGPGASIETKIGSPDGSFLSGLPVRWDSVSQELLPVQPGSHRVTWPDADGSGNTYVIEIVTAMPGDAAALTTHRENEDGSRQSPPGYVKVTPALAQISSDYPAAPLAHYRHIFDPIPGRRPPTKLDLNNTDEWAFQDLPFAEKGTSAIATKTAAGVPFESSGSGRSVLLYSIRPNPDEIADGNLTKEKLAVRIVNSAPVGVISRNDSKLVLGRHALQLGSSTMSAGAYGVIQTGGVPATASIDPGSKFVVDFWLNAKSLKSSTPVTLAGCVTTTGSNTVTCASTSAVVAGMGIKGKNIPAGAKITSVTNATTLQLSTPATANGTALSLTATNKPVTVFSTGGGGLKLTLDPEGSTATATYRGIPVTHSLSKSGVAWRHYAVHAFTYTFFGVQVAIVDFYLDGVRQEKGFVTSMFPGAALSTVSPSLSDNSLRFGVDAMQTSGLMLDNFRVFNLGSDPIGYLTPGEIRQLRSQRDLTLPANRLRSVVPLVSFDFENAPTSGWFANQGSLTNVGVGTVVGSGLYAGKWAETDLQEVATRIDSTLDNANFGGSGYVLNSNSNFNTNLYSRSNEIGTWGPVFPVNHHQLFTDANKRLEVAYYENPYLTDRPNNPNVAWPYVATEFKDVVFPAVGKDKDKAIYIASRIGSEGVDRTGRAQTVFSAANYSDLTIYNQPDKALAGYNPNEEHALAAPGGRAALKVKNMGEDVPNSPPPAAFALQRDINATSTSYSSDPWVLVQVNNLSSGEPEMAAYQVFKTRSGTIAFPRPATAVVNAANSGMAYETAANPEDGFLTIDSEKSVDFSYQFDYPVFAGDLLIPPYPLNLVIGNVPMRDARGNSIQVNGINQRSLWRDKDSNAWVVSGNGRFFHQFFYPFRGDFHLPGTLAGTPVAWLPDNGVNYTGIGTTLNPVKVLYNTSWRSNYPKLKRGETLTYQGGEYFNETPGAKGLPALVAMAASEIIYDSSTPSMSFGAATTNRYDVSKASARIIRAIDRRENLFTVAQMGTAGFTPAAATKVLIIAERWYFKELPDRKSVV